MERANPFLGRWDATIERPGRAFPTWFEIEEGPDGLRGRLVGEVGSARPIERFQLEGGRLRFALKPQYEPRKTDLEFVAEADGGRLRGTFLDNDGSTVAWTAKRAPDFAGRKVEAWGDPIDLIAQGLDAWTARSPEAPFCWSIQDGMLANSGVGSDLVTKARFGDFRLEAEYSYPQGSNSGIYLRGRYEMQILDDAGGGNGVGNSGAIYGFLAPKVNAAKPAGEWQRAEIELVGRTVTIVLNGVTIHDHAEIPGITGGALESDEAEPGPLFLQGDHGPVTFRRLVVTPAR